MTRGFDVQPAERGIGKYLVKKCAATTYPPEALASTIFVTLDGRDYAAGVIGSHLLGGATPDAWNRAALVVQARFAR